MIEFSIFNVWLTENNKVNITSKYTFKEEFYVVFKEKYTGLSIFKTSTQFTKGVNYWYKIGPTFNIINGIIIEIRNNNDILFKETINVGENINIKLEEKIHYDKNDTNSWAPFYEVFIKNSYESDLVKLDEDEDWLLNAKIRQSFLIENFGINEIYKPEHITHNNSSFENNNIESLLTRYKDIEIPDKIKEFIKNDNELHYLIGKLNYNFINL